jgi:bifunctional DNA-binding transcriptional regulator/antitoxin component of YhaV-PrlF toxin-antitoxin module
MTTVSDKGEVKIPEPFLKALGMLPGTEVEFEQQNDAVVMRVVKLKRISQVEDGPKILNYTGPSVSLEEME